MTLPAYPLPCRRVARGDDPPYALSTLAQTCAALAAFVGAVGLYKLQSLRDERARNEQTIRGLLGTGVFGTLDVAVTPLDEIIRVAREQVSSPTLLMPVIAGQLRSAVAVWDAFPNRHRRATMTLFIFEAWNLLLIAVSLIGFNYVKSWASSSWWTFWGVWVTALGTVAVRGYSVYAWTRE